MEGAGKLVAGLVIGLVVGGGAGVVAGGATGAKLGSDNMALSWIATEASRSKETIAVLEQLRAKDEKALAALETHLDRHLFGLTPAALEPFKLDAATRTVVDEAIDRARKYRAANPRPATNPLEKDVDAGVITPPK